MSLNESTVEDAALEWFGELGDAVGHGPHLAPQCMAGFVLANGSMSSNQSGDVEPLRAEAIAAELDELPLPYRFEVQPLAHIHYRPLLEHIKRVGILIYPPT